MVNGDTARVQWIGMWACAGVWLRGPRLLAETWSGIRGRSPLKLIFWLLYVQHSVPMQGHISPTAEPWQPGSQTGRFPCNGPPDLVNRDVMQPTGHFYRPIKTNQNKQHCRHKHPERVTRNRGNQCSTTFNRSQTPVSKSRLWFTSRQLHNNYRQNVAQQCRLIDRLQPASDWS